MNTERMIRWYERLLVLYPANFRAVFGEELQVVFADSLHDAARCGDRAAWQCFLRELLDLPLNLLREYFSGQGLNALIERLLTHKKRTRWQQSGALGFMLGFALLELLNGLPQIRAGGAYISWLGWFKVTLGDQQQPPPAGLELYGLMCLAAAGLLAGWVFSLAERGGSLRFRLRAGLAGAVAMLAPYLIFFAAPGLLNVATKGWSSLEVTAINLGKLAWMIFSVGGLPPAVFATLLGWLRLTPTRGGLNKIRALVSAGLAGIILGYAWGFFTALVLGLGLSPILTQLPGGPSALHTQGWTNYLALFCLLAAIASGSMGRVYGGWVGRQMGEYQQPAVES